MGNNTGLAGHLLSTGRKANSTYKHYNLTPQDDGTVAVYHPRSPSKPVYLGKSVDDAKHFVRGYRDGVLWAVQAAL